jgi:formylglycine-generating enzyme required for sulfatase activity
VSGKFEGRRAEYTWKNPGYLQGDDHPVVNVTWNDAVAFCEWLSKKESKVYRLPTEAAWEHACRAGTTTHFHSGDDKETLVKVANIADAKGKLQFPDWDDFAIFGRDGYTFTAPVGSFQPNAWGLHDMHGNVWEWCNDWHGEDYYKKSPRDDPQGPADGELRVRRGGAWHTYPLYVRAAFRNYNTPHTRYLNLGFRVARNR